VKRKPTMQEASSHHRREKLATDVDKFVRAGNRIQQIPDGVSGQDPHGNRQPYRRLKPATSTPE